MNEHAEVITKEAKKVAPKDTGTLANSIGFKQVAMVGRLPKKIQVEATAPYSEFVHGRFRRLPSGYKPPPPKRRKNWGNPNWRTKPHYPPIQPIEDWATKRNLNTWGVVQSINERGTPLVPFLLLAEKNTRKAIESLDGDSSSDLELFSLNHFSGFRISLLAIAPGSIFLWGGCRPPRPPALQWGGSAPPHPSEKSAFGLHGP